MRYPIYSLNVKVMQEMLDKKEWIIRSTSAEEKLKDATFKVEYVEGDKLIKVNGKVGTKLIAYFHLSQMEGNCNGAMVSMIHGQGTGYGDRVDKSVEPELTTFVLKNVMSMLGDNVAHGSHYDSVMPGFEKYGWKTHLKMPTNRGYKHDICYASLSLQKEEMATVEFAEMINAKTVRTAQAKLIAA